MTGTTDQTIAYCRGTQWATGTDGRHWVLGDDYDRLWWALTEIAKHDSSEYSDEHRLLVRLARAALRVPDNEAAPDLGRPVRPHRSGGGTPRVQCVLTECAHPGKCERACFAHEQSTGYV